MDIIEILDDLEKQNITRYILEALPEWFGLPESREDIYKIVLEKYSFVHIKIKNQQVFYILMKLGKIQ